MERSRRLLILSLVLAIGLSGCALPATFGTWTASPSGWSKPSGYQQTTTLVEIPALLAAGGVFAVIDLILLPFQALLGSGNFFPLLGTMAEVFTRLFGDDEPAAEPRPPPKDAAKSAAKSAADRATPAPEATRPRQ